MVRSFVIAISECLVGVSSESSQVRANACVCVCRGESQVYLYYTTLLLICRLLKLIMKITFHRKLVKLFPIRIPQ